MTAHADDIAALRRLLEGEEGFDQRIGFWTYRDQKGAIVGYSVLREEDRYLSPDLARAEQCDLDRAVGAAMEMLRERHGVRYLGRLIAEAVPDDAEFGSKGSPRLLPLLAEVLCEPAGREGA